MAGRIALKIGLVFASTILLFFIAAFAILNWPTIVINPYVIKKAANYASHFGYDIELGRIDVSSDSMGLLDNRIKIDLKKACVKTDSALKEACFDDVSVSFRHRLSWFVPQMREIGPIDMTGGIISYEYAGKDCKTERHKRRDGRLMIPSATLPLVIRNTSFFPIKIGIKNFRYLKCGREIQGKTDVAAEIDEKNRLTNINLNALLKLPRKEMSIDIKGDIKSLSGFVRDDVAFDGKLKVASARTGQLALAANIRKAAKDEIKYSGEISFKNGEVSAHTPIDGSLTSESISAGLRLNVTAPRSLVEKIDTESCELRLALTDVHKNNGRLKFSCPLTARLKAIDLPDEVEPIYRPPAAIHITIASDLDTFFIPDSEHPTTGNIDIHLSSARSNLVETDGSMTVRLDGKFADFPAKMRLSSNMDIDFNIRDFSRLAYTLKNTRYSIPAPFHILTGSVEFSLHGNIPSLQAMSSFPVAFKSMLEAENEKIYLDATGEARFRFKGAMLADADFDLDVILTDVEVPLPNIQLAGLPRLLPDPRIRLKEPAEEKADSAALNYKIDISTSDEAPLRILSNISEKPIPIHLNLKGDGGKFLGTIGLDSFSINLFRKKGLVKEFKMALKDPFKRSLVSGEFQVQADEYLVNILMKGTVEHPNMWFESKPPLSEENIIAVLMYGEPFDDLDEGKALSIGNMRAAMANKALALATFFIFASSPIQSVAYDPETNAIAAKIRLGEKTSLTVGSTGEERRGVGIRHRLGKGWFINTTVNEDREEATTSGSALIEWHKRY